MGLKEFFVEAWWSLVSYRQRASITLLGVAVGIAAVVTVVVIGQGGKEMVAREIRDAGENLFVVGVMGERGVELAREGDLELADAELARRGVERLRGMVPNASQLSVVKTAAGRFQVAVLGTTDELVQQRGNVQLAEGRFISPRDLRSARRVAVVSGELAEDLASRGRLVDSRLFLANTSLTVIGVTERRERSLLAGSGPPRIYIPITLFHRLYQTRRVGWLEGQAQDEESVEAAMAETVRLVGRRHPGKTEYAGETLAQSLRTATEAIDVVAAVVAAIAAVSLFVAAIGVVNVMLISVSERTREIGLRKSVGATRRQVLGQFLVEAVLLCAAGGIVGTVMGALSSAFLTRLLSLPFVFPWQGLGLAMALSTAVGVVAGTYPAVRAAELDPIVALRRE